MLRALAALGIVLLLLGAGLVMAQRSPASRALPVTFALPKGVQLVGCEGVWAGPICELGEARKIRLVVMPGGPELDDLRADTGPLESVRQERDGDTRRIEMVLPPSASALTARVRRSGREERLTLRTIPRSDPPWLDRAREARERGALDEALTLVTPRLAGSPRERAAALGMDARIAGMRGDYPHAVRAFEAARADFLDLGALSRASDDGVAEAFMLANRVHDYPRARAVLDSLTPLAASHAETWATLPYFEAILADATGDVRAFLELAAEAERRAARLGLERERRDALELRALASVSMGRFSDACRTLQSLLADTPARDGICSAASLRVNLGATALDARAVLGVVPETCPPDPAAMLAAAVRDYESDCPDRTERANALLELSRAHVLAHRPAEAEAALKAFAPDVASLPPNVRVDALLLEGDVALERRDARKARATFAAASAGAARFAWQWREVRALLGTVHAEAIRGGAAAALAILDAELPRLRAAANVLPLGEGRLSYLAAVEAASRVRIELLLARGGSDRALAEALQSRARATLGAGLSERVHGLSGDMRSRWDRATFTYAEARSALEDATARARELSESELASSRRALAAAEVELRRELGQAVDDVGATGEPGARWPCAGDDPATGALVLWEIDGGLAVIFADHAGKTRHHVVANLPLGATERAEALFGPIAGELAHVTRLRVIADASTWHLDVHALPFRGRPLGATLAVEYSVAGGCPRARSTSPVPPDGRDVAIVSDPTGDLPGAREESRTLLDALSKAGARAVSVAQAEATARATRDALTQSAIVHFAGHARHGGEAAWSSALVLHDGASLDTADVFALPRVPRVVVLSACDAAEDSFGTIGIAQAIVLRGADAVVAAVRPVADHPNGGFWRDFYAALLRERRTDAAAAIQIALHASPSNEAGLSYRVLVP